MAWFQLAYMSSIATDEPGTWPAIVHSSMRNNQMLEITGMLLHADGNVVQVLEGDRHKVMSTFRKIELDQRHCGIIVLLYEEIAARQFQSWSMGYKTLCKENFEHLTGGGDSFRIRQDEISVRVREGCARTVLETFAQNTI